MTATELAPAPPRVADIDTALGDDTLAQLSGLFAAHGDAFRVHSPLLGKDLFVLSHPDHVRHVLVDNQANFGKGIGIERVAILLGNGLMTSDGALWRAQRKAIQPAFHRTAVQGHLDDIVAANRRLAERLGAQAGESIDITQELSELTLEIVLRAIFGSAYEQLVADTNPFALLNAESDRDLKFAYAFRKLGGRVQQEIAARRTARVSAALPSGDILQTLVDATDRQSGEPMPDRQIRDEVLTLIVAGHETTASALSWTWYLIAQHPQVAAQLHAEVDAASDDERARPTAARFTYAGQVIAEALRLYPPGWLLTRRARAPASIAGVEVNAGDEILISPYLVHRHPGFWPDAACFEPARFAADTAASRSRFCYLPFGLGPRACIGESLALVEMLAQVVTLAHRFDVTLVPGQAINMEAKVNLRPRPAILVRASARNCARISPHNGARSLA
ncbi:MAG: cytochrome P450 [Betaproteobacteria bacterium]